ncbi:MULTISPECIES: hypothetical protein [Flavobacterium]|uniref:Uncharacterized protein n=1 Tax=Flavobacterium columnare TaxID=996 RepID=A0AA94EXW2_9FLAO|nr:MULTISPECIES: hypothetical protein [Flavobacterium]MCH4828612.1 hypothetical protein [Flavobacterium columnare]MCH4831865.1 hypothetical protein [Flavobacterium columnare]QYS90514.1 hypothetical protein JJC04_10590 [Flavobacterium covae]QYS90537.1 hypothetical protein JJC04_10715 [Flavobacterium covae]
MSSEKYYVLSESFCLDSNQWSILIGAIGVLLTLLGFIIAFVIYQKQRNDNAQDAFNYFQSSLPELKKAIEGTIESLKTYAEKLKDENDDFGNPVLTSSLNDNFLSRLNITDLNRFYTKLRISKIQDFRKFLINTNFLGSYHNYFVNEIDYFRDNYLEKEKTYNKWQLLRSNKFFSSMRDENERYEYKEFYSKWVKDLNSDRDVFEFSEDDTPKRVKNRTLLVDKHIKPLAQNIFPHIEFSEKANDINLIANEVYSSYSDIKNMKQKVREVIVSDIAKFEVILENLNSILESQEANA